MKRSVIAAPATANGWRRLLKLAQLMDAAEED